MANPAMTLIQSIVLGSSSSAVSFASIPGTYQDLKLICSLRSDIAGSNSSFYLTFNGASTNFSDTYLSMNGTTIGSARDNAGANSFLGAIEGSTELANVFSHHEFYIPGYASNSLAKPFGGFSTQENNNASPFFMYKTAGLWNNTSPITSLSLTNSANFVQYSSFTLYGIKNS